MHILVLHMHICSVAKCHTMLSIHVHVYLHALLVSAHIQFACMHCLIPNLQQDEVISELKEFARSDPRPDSAASVERVVLYLEALNKLFERGLL